jgi:hypothetical protein
MTEQFTFQPSGKFILCASASGRARKVMTRQSGATRSRVLLEAV